MSAVLMPLAAPPQRRAAVASARRDVSCQQRLATASTFGQRRPASARRRNITVVAALQDEKASAAAYDKTDGGIKALVGGLTGLVNAAFGVKEEKLPPPVGTVTPEEVFKGVEEDFTVNGYLWTGEITDNLYDPDCEFTDPTLSFTGLATFKRNLANLQPILKRVLLTREVDLLSCELDRDAGAVVARWRMGGDLDFFWRPRVELTGCTRFFYDAKRGGRVVRYRETWDIGAGEALMQLVRPGRHRGDRGKAAAAE